MPTYFLYYLFVVTAYCGCEKCCEQWADGITTSGHIIQYGDKFVAAPAIIPFNATMVIPGYGTVPVLDRGGVIKDRRLDVYFDKHQDAIEWGKRLLFCFMKGAN